MRKTVEIALIKEKANKLFANSTNEMIKEREAVFGFVSNLLTAAGQYKGFGYLTENQVTKGLTFGVIHGPDFKSHEFKDESRVFFY